MQQRQLRLGDILDDYCPRERRLTNHAVVAMIGDDVKQTRCTTCDAEHEYKHAKVPRQRRKSETPAALYATGARGDGPKRVRHEPERADGDEPETPLRRSTEAGRRPTRQRRSQTTPGSARGTPTTLLRPKTPRRLDRERS